MSHVFCLNNFTCNHDADDQNDESSISYASDFNQMSIACCFFITKCFESNRIKNDKFLGISIIKVI